MQPDETAEPHGDAREAALGQEIERLNKITRVLMDRSERMTSEAVSEYGRFQRRIVLGEVVQQQTEELTQALSRNETIMRRLKLSEGRLRGLAEQSLVGIAVVESSRLTFANTRFAETFGYTREEILALPLLSTVAESSRAAFTEHLRMCSEGEAHGTLEYRGLRRDGEIVDIELASSLMTTEEEDALILVIDDVTARKQAERKVSLLNSRLADLAVRDPLTDLYNRRFMEESLAREVANAARSGSPVSVAMCDIDHFKSINDVHGHQAGDEVLKAFASLLRNQSRKSDIACRYGGEEFLLVFPGMSATRAMKWADFMSDTVATAQIPTTSGTLQITASFGLATYPAHGQTAASLVAAADAALYLAKMSGRNRVKCAPAGGNSKLDAVLQATSPAPN